VIINKHSIVLALEGCTHRADLNAWRIVAMKTLPGEPVWLLIRMIFHQNDIQPFLVRLEIMPFLAALDALPGVFAPGQVNNHYKRAPWNTLSGGFSYRRFTRGDFTVIYWFVYFDHLSLTGKNLYFFNLLTGIIVTCHHSPGT
jgi:hypothetical protein